MSYQEKYYILEASLKEPHQNPQVVWETLVEGGIWFSDSNAIMEKIEALFDCPEDAPEPSGSMEILGRLVPKITIA